MVEWAFFRNQDMEVVASESSFSVVDGRVHEEFLIGRRWGPWSRSRGKWILGWKDGSSSREDGPSSGSTIPFP